MEKEQLCQRAPHTHINTYTDKHTHAHTCTQAGTHARTQRSRTIYFHVQTREYARPHVLYSLTNQPSTLINRQAG